MAYCDSTKENVCSTDEDYNRSREVIFVDAVSFNLSSKSLSRRSKSALKTEGRKRSGEFLPQRNAKNRKLFRSYMDQPSGRLSSTDVEAGESCFCRDYFYNKFSKDPQHNVLLDPEGDDAFKKMELVRSQKRNKFYPMPNYIAQQTMDKTKRIRIMADVIEASYNVRVKPRTRHLAIRLVDRFASTYVLTEEHQQSIPWAAFSLAAKYFEPESISMAAYESWVDRETIVHMESFLLGTLDFRVDDLMPIHFAERFFIQVVTEVERRMLMKSNVSSRTVQRTTKKFNALLWYLLDLAMIDYECLQFAHTPRFIAAACVAVGCTITGRLNWPKDHLKVLRELDCPQFKIKPIVKRIYELPTTSIPIESRMYQKYNTEEHFYISSKIQAFYVRKRSAAIFSPRNQLYLQSIYSANPQVSVQQQE